MNQPALFSTPKRTTRTPGKDDWLKTLLENKTGGFRAARWERCNTCQELTLHGMDADMCAGMVTADPTPLSPQQELACMIIGRPTFTLKPRGQAYELHDRRDAHKHGPRPPDHKGRTVIPAHQCGARFPGFIQRPTTKETPNAEPDF
ncbi:hypothetical protein [Paenarthrobacter sp. C1]|uniref:hypothetical protein n=1 Tax=Paenarthrobacter sp. C1 TaxID=3400220 RepID=UPI003BF5F2D5